MCVREREIHISPHKHYDSCQRSTVLLALYKPAQTSILYYMYHEEVLFNTE